MLLKQVAAGMLCASQRPARALTDLRTDRQRRVFH